MVLISQSGIAYYDLNCEDGDLLSCHAVAKSQCAQSAENVRVSNHFVRASEVNRITFYCTNEKTQLIPDNITFDDGL